MDFTAANLPAVADQLAQIAHEFAGEPLDTPLEEAGAKIAQAMVLLLEAANLIDDAR